MSAENDLVLPDGLAIGSGADRGVAVGGAEREAIRAWLAEFHRKPNTQRAYSREARRFWLWWSTTHPERPLREMGRQDLDAYISVLADPPAAWVHTGEPGWRPLRGPLSETSRRQALIILQSLFEYLVQSGVLRSNVVRMVRDKGPVPHRARRLVPAEAAITRIASWMQSDHGSGIGPRDAFLWQWIYWTGARRHELEHARLSGIQSSLSGGRTRWWWDLIGKGEKAASIPLDDAAIDALVTWLSTSRVELPDLLRRSPEQALAPARRASSQGIGPSGVYLAVRRVAAIAAENSEEIGLSEDDARAIAQVRPHTLRAFRATHLFEAGVDPRHVQRFMRHADFNTTLIYDHTDEAQFHDGVLNGNLVTRAVPLPGRPSAAHQHHEDNQ